MNQSVIKLPLIQSSFIGELLMKHIYYIIAIFFLGLNYMLLAQPQVVDIAPSKDNTLYESSTGNLSNGAGDYFFAGKTNSGAIRRAVLAFDLSVIPSNAVIEEVQLTLNMSQTSSGSQLVKLHKLLADWGEGTSNADGNEGAGTTPSANDATWIHTFFSSQLWSSAGGDFVGSESASLSVGADGIYTWQSPQMIADVQEWVSNPATNFGWIILGNEQVNRTAKRFDSRENPIVANRPNLTVTYNVSVGIDEDTPTALSFELAQNYPNPFNPSTSLRYTIPQILNVRLEVFNVLGQLVKVLVNEPQNAGVKTVVWDGTNAFGRKVSSGVYLYKLTAGNFVQTRKMILLK